jgi:chromosome segregation ATPase
MKNDKKPVFIVITLLIGLLLGYGIWGKKEEQKMGVKDLLGKAMQEVETIEKENQELKKKLGKSTGNGEDTEKISREKKELQQELEKAQSNNKQLQSVIARMRSESAKTQKIKADDRLKNQLSMVAQEKQVVTEKLQKVQQENQKLNNMISQVKSELDDAKGKMKAHEELIFLSEDLKSQISELTKENQELKRNLDKIGNLTQGVEEIETEAGQKAEEAE